jgi:hypothetical protein
LTRLRVAVYSNLSTSEEAMSAMPELPSAQIGIEHSDKPAILPMLRPTRQLYMGPTPREFVPLAERAAHDPLVS